MRTMPTPLHLVTRRLLAAGLVTVLAACGGRVPAGAAPAPAPASTAGTDSLRVTPDAIARARADSARLPWTEADARFMTMMIQHHAQAVTMSRMAPTHDASPQLRTLAERIINAQFDEIRLMRRWLLERERPAPDPLAAGGQAGHAGMDHGAMHHGTTMDHGASMPGMLTPEQLRQLDQARGREFDRLFLTFMIRHHEGAVQMVDELFATAGAAQDLLAFEIASDVQVDQRTEIARMRRMLVQLEVGS